ncbi:hypothetical protein D3C85_1275410 [compost metagenome]
MKPQRIGGDGDQCAREQQALPLRRHQSQRHPQRGQDERELADLRQARAHRQCRAQRVAHQQHQCARGDRLAHHDHQDHREHMQRVLDQYRGVEQHPYRDEEQNGKGVAQRQQFLCGPLAEVGFAHDHPREKSA